MTKEDSNAAQAGQLYLVPTPLGNLLDLSPRAQLILQTCDSIACEDTRVTQKLLQLFDIKKSLLSYRDSNEIEQAEYLAQLLSNGQSIALVCDAGTPTLSDPGFRLVRLCHKMKIPVVPLPGPAAATTALSASGLPSNRFYFVGFLPPKKSARQQFFQDQQHCEDTIIFYESCHRIDKFIDDAVSILGAERWACLCRELTKKHETILTAPLGEIQEHLRTHSRKGEFVVLIAAEKYAL